VACESRGCSQGGRFENATGIVKSSNRTNKLSTVGSQKKSSERGKREALSRRGVATTTKFAGLSLPACRKSRKKAGEGYYALI